MIIVAGLFSCNNNHSSCPVVTVDVAMDSFIDTDHGLETPELSEKYRKSIIGLSKKCKPGFVYEAEMSCRLISDTTFLLGFIRNTESRMCCEITDLHQLERINNGDLTGETGDMGGCTESNGYFVLFPEGVGCSYPWAAYVSDCPGDAKKQTYNSILYKKGIPIFCYDRSWHSAQVGRDQHFLFLD